ncbi:MAG: HIT family protein [Nitrososphaera sp.]
MQDCIFCKIVQGKVPARIIAQSERAMAFLDAFPLAAGHTLVVPKAHHVKVQDMGKEDSEAVFALVHEIVQKVESAADTTASLIAVHNGRGAGQEVPHVHVHIIPRKAGDGAGPVHSMFRKPKVTAEEMDAILSKMA